MKLLKTKSTKTIFTLELTEDEVLAIRIVFGRQNSNDYEKHCEISVHEDARELWKKEGYKLFNSIYQTTTDLVGYQTKRDVGKIKEQMI